MSFSIEDYTWPAFQGRTPFDHQKVTTSFLIRNPNAFVLNEMGTGKTLAALWATDILMCAQKIKRVLIIGPLSSLKSVWHKEIRLNMPHRKAVVAHGNASIRTAAIFDTSAEFVIINHDGVRFAEDELVKMKFDVIIIDELTAFKSHAAERSKAMFRIARSARAVWGMTGNLTPNSPTEAFFPCKIVNPKSRYLPRYFTQFQQATMQQINEYMWVPKPDAPAIVHLVVQPAIRYTRDECLDLPETMFQTIDVPITAEQQKHYDLIKQQAYMELADDRSISAVNAGVKLGKLLQISSGAVKDDNGEVVQLDCKNRLDTLVELFEQTPQRKIVVAVKYVATIHMIEAEMAKRKIKCSSIYGNVSKDERAKRIEDFQTGDLEMIVLQDQTAAHAITLTAASTLVWFTLDSSNELFEQLNARIVRAGQTRHTLIIMFVSTEAERHVAGLLSRRESVSKATLELFAQRAL